ncbi:MAG: hypothetical protein M0Q91_17360 [Methanoregula sp.]|jgi:hypothetical protein|nr:hypothetical protein [Methanoregula sp.]
MPNHYKQFAKYAISMGVHDGPATLAALSKVYEEHKGSRWITIVALFKAQGAINFLRDYNKEMGYK